MKKYLLLSIIIFSALIFAGLSFSVVFALPSFEVYPAGKNPWPEITDVVVNKVGATVTITAIITDTSKVNSATVTIKDSVGDTMNSGLMNNNGVFPDDSEIDDIYTAQFSVSSYPSGDYYVYISATDNLGITTPEPLEVGTFNIPVSICVKINESTVNEAELCIEPIFASNPSTISSLVVNPSPAQPGELITITATLSSAVEGETIVFKDNTTNATIGSRITNSQGIAALPYFASISTTFQANYSGNYLKNLAPSYKTVSLTVTNPVPTTTSISPTSETAGSSAFTLTVNGTNFVSSSVVNFAGSARTTTFVNFEKVTASILISDLTTAGTFNITVTNPSPGGGTSNSQTFTVTPWLAGWSYRKAITISNYRIDSGANFVNFPLYVKISADSNMAIAQANGYDIRFTQSDGTSLLNYERESWSGGGGTAASGNFWVKVPTISYSPLTMIYIYYGKSGASDGQNATAVWDTNYKGVWHLKESSGNISDSTSNNRTGTAYGNATGTSSGKIGGGSIFDGTGDYYQSPSWIPPIGAITLETWVNFSDISTNRAILEFMDAYNGSAYDRQLFLNSSQKQVFHLWPGANVDVVGSSSLAANIWYHIVAVIHSNPGYATYGSHIYVNGSEAGPKNPAGTDGYNGYSTAYLFLGAKGSVSPYGTNDFYGKLDEVRVSNTARSLEWINFQYYNMSSVTNELIWGSQESP